METPAGDFGPVHDDSEPDPPRHGGWAPVDLSGYLDGTYEPPVATHMRRTDGVALLYPGMTHSFHGESESFKSMILQAQAAALLLEGHRVLYVDYEADAGSVVDRLVSMGVGREQLAAGFVYVQPEVDHERSEQTRAAFDLLLSELYTLAVLDGVSEALAQTPAKARSTAGLGGNDDITAWHDRLPRVIARRTGAAVVLVDHVAKSPDAGRFAIGGQAKMATLSGAAYLVRPTSPGGRGLVGSADVFVAKDRHGYVRGHATGAYGKDCLQLVAVAVVDGTDGLRVSLVPPPAMEGPAAYEHELMARVAAYLSANPDASKTRIRNNVTGDATAVGQAVDALVAERYATAKTNGRGATYRLVKAYTTSDFDRGDEA